MATPRLAIWLWYRGDHFRGFQAQAQGPTVQGVLSEALARCGVEAGLAPAGRTDRGVHARMQVVSLRAPPEEPEALLSRLAPLLPAQVGVCLLRRKEGFHAQWRCIGKEYRYRIALAEPPPAWRGACWHPGELRYRPARVDPALIDELLRRCVGTHDFYAFHEKTSSRQPRTIRSIQTVELAPGLFDVRLAGHGFARYQVRYLVGSAVAVAAGTLSKEHFLAALEAAAPFRPYKAPGEGLTLWEVHYPPELDPFTAEERSNPPGLPGVPPFTA